MSDDEQRRMGGEGILSYVAEESKGYCTYITTIFHES